MAKLWAEMLDLEEVGLYDNFFELGGNSLLAARLADRVQKAIRKPVPLAAIFREPTIAALARHVESHQGNTFDLLEPIRTAGSGAWSFALGSA